MFETVEDITWDYEDEGTLTRRTLEKIVLTKGAWSTIIFKFEELDRKTDEWRKPKAVIARYQKRNGVYARPHSKFNISSSKQAKQIVDALQELFPEDEE